eukprot:TRINITY_DN1675_c0_g1_i1.p1 TRINITY_DN1675_c0_g1~~TRINITY_DN1675_c0_g1_i1.p1  ORF type:complete len:646 (-),score=133.82 TRINITY_DN1675_c0_g1_i1:228-2165(-)
MEEQNNPFIDFDANDYLAKSISSSVHQPSPYQSYYPYSDISPSAPPSELNNPPPYNPSYNGSLSAPVNRTMTHYMTPSSQILDPRANIHYTTYNDMHDISYGQVVPDNTSSIYDNVPSTIDFDKSYRRSITLGPVNAPEYAFPDDNLAGAALESSIKKLVEVTRFPSEDIRRIFPYFKTIRGSDDGLNDEKLKNMFGLLALSDDAMALELLYCGFSLEDSISYMQYLRSIYIISRAKNNERLNWSYTSICEISKRYGTGEIDDNIIQLVSSIISGILESLGLRANTSVSSTLQHYLESRDIIGTRETYDELAIALSQILLRVYKQNHFDSSSNTLIPGLPDYDLGTNIALGIQMTTEIAKDQHDEDFCKFYLYEKIQLVLPSTSSGLGYSFRSYAPLVFRKLRQKFNVSEEDYILSLGIEQMVVNLYINGRLTTYKKVGSYGKSGSIFFYTDDGKYLIKTIHENESENLKSILEDYYIHMVQDHPTLIVPILGFYSIKKSSENVQYFVVMPNMFCTEYDMEEIYDVKGSIYGRNVPESERRHGVPLKDAEFNERGGLFLDLVKKQKIMASIARDSKFLEMHGLIDYSLLIGIHKSNWPVDPTKSNTHVSFDGGEVYVLGIIDYLVKWTGSVSKKLENLAKSFFCT